LNGLPGATDWSLMLDLAPDERRKCLEEHLMSFSVRVRRIVSVAKIA
jgi:hypothetical protein